MGEPLKVGSSKYKGPIKRRSTAKPLVRGCGQIFATVNKGSSSANIEIFTAILTKLTTEHFKTMMFLFFLYTW